MELRNVTLQAGAFRLSQLNWQIPTGKYSVLMGRSGVGKTSLLEALCGLRRLQSGAILINSQDVTRASPADRQTGYVPQDLALFPTFTVQQHLEFALHLRRWDKHRIAARVEELATQLRIEPLLPRKVQHLSGGEAQRVALGRALSFFPQIVLLDEPLSALDESTRHHLQDLLRDTQRSTGVTFLHVTHSQSEAHAVADNIFLLENGSVREVEGRVHHGEEKALNQKS